MTKEVPLEFMRFLPGDAVAPQYSAVVRPIKLQSLAGILTLMNLLSVNGCMAESMNIVAISRLMANTCSILQPNMGV